MPCMCKMLCFPKESLLLVRDSLSLQHDAAPTLWLNPSDSGVSHESLKLLNAVKCAE